MFIIILKHTTVTQYTSVVSKGYDGKKKIDTTPSLLYVFYFVNVDRPQAESTHLILLSQLTDLLHITFVGHNKQRLAEQDNLSLSEISPILKHLHLAVNTK